MCKGSVVTRKSKLSEGKWKSWGDWSGKRKGEHVEKGGWDWGWGLGQDHSGVFGHVKEYYLRILRIHQNNSNAGQLIDKCIIWKYDSDFRLENWLEVEAKRVLVFFTWRNVFFLGFATVPRSLSAQ